MSPDHALERYSQLVLKIARAIHRKTRGAVELDELVAMGIEGLLEAASRADPGQGSDFVGYAFLRVRGAILDNLGNIAPLPRRAHRQVKAERMVARATPLDPDRRRDPESDSDGEVESRRMWQALRGLPVETQAVLRAIYVEGRTVSELARSAGVAPSSVSRRHRRALARLRAALIDEAA